MIEILLAFAQVIFRTFGFAATNDSLSFERAVAGVHNCALTLAVVAVVIDNDPVIRLAELVRAWSVGEQCGVVATASGGVKHRQPRFAFRIESAGSDSGQEAFRRFGAILAIYIETLRD